MLWDYSVIPLGVAFSQEQEEAKNHLGNGVAIALLSFSTLSSTLL
jgi:hypothetical protein